MLKIPIIILTAYFKIMKIQKIKRQKYLKNQRKMGKIKIAKEILLLKTLSIINKRKKKKQKN